MKYIPLSAGLATQVDDADYPALSQYKWYALQTVKHAYASRYEPCPDGGPRRRIYMHRVIIHAKHGELVDHVDRDSLNNQRSNLRICTYSENAANAKYDPGAGSQFKGVSRYKNRRHEFVASISFRGKRHIIGAFATELEAAVAYDLAARAMFGAFALLNFP